MKFCFVSPIYHMEIDRKINNGLKLDNMNISNTTYFLKKSVLEEPFLSVLGNYLVYDFYDDRFDPPYIQPHFYFEGSVNGFSSIEELSMSNTITGFGFGTEVVILFLYECQRYLKKLWHLKDNSIYIRDGFVKFYYEDDREKSRIFRYSLKEIFIDSVSSRDTTTFTKRELEEAYESLDKSLLIFKEMKNIDMEKLNKIIDQNSKYLNIFSNKNSFTRLEKGDIFKNYAREQMASDMKIFFYISALEAFFNTSKSEITFQVSQRCALLLGKTYEEKIEIQRTIKKAYDVRSHVVHGATYKEKKYNDDFLKSLAQTLDNYIRILLNDTSNIFSKNDEALKQYFDQLIYKNNN